jgi:hypothetical protein
MSQPADWAQLQWHRAPGRARYYSRQKAERAVRWLNANEHVDDVWRFRVGGVDRDGRWWLQRRWVGEVVGLIDQLEAGHPDPPSDPLWAAEGP